MFKRVFQWCRTLVNRGLKWIEQQLLLQTKPSTALTPAWNVPKYYDIYTHNFSITEDMTLDLTIPAKRVEVSIQDPAGVSVSGVALTTNPNYNASLPPVASLPDGDLLLAEGYSYQAAPALTNASGSATLWLFPNSSSYTLTARPPINAPFAVITLPNLAITEDRSLIIVLQFVHTPPFTAVSLSPAPVSEGIYPGSVTVTLSATAYSGFTIDATYYAVDGGPQQTYTSPFVIEDDGQHSIEYWSVDNAGVYESPKTTTFQIASLRIVTESPLPSGTLGVPYSVTLEAAGGTPPYTWSVINGALPPGLTLNAATGEISGTPTTAGTFGFTIQVMDSTQLSASKPFAVAPPPPSGTAGSGYTLPISVPDTPPGGTSGTPSCTNYSVVSGTLPDGLTLDPATGIVSGTPTNGGTYSFTIGCTVTSGPSQGQTATKDFTITIENPAPTLISLDPSSHKAGTETFTLILNGTNSVQSSVARWNGSDRPTTYLSSTQLTAEISAADIAAQGMAQVTVFNPDPIGGLSNALPFTILPPNAPPVAVDDAVSTDEDVAVPINVAANDSDADGNLTPSTVSVVTGVSSGTLTNNGDGTLLYTPNANYYGSDGFSYQICDTEGECDTASVSIIVNPVNDPPVITVNQGSVTVDEGQPASNSGAVSDVEGNAVLLTASAGIAVNNGDGTWSWSFTTSDGPAQSQTVTIEATDGKG